MLFYTPDFTLAFFFSATHSLLKTDPSVTYVNNTISFCFCTFLSSLSTATVSFIFSWVPFLHSLFLFFPLLLLVSFPFSLTDCIHVSPISVIHLSLFHQSLCYLLPSSTVEKLFPSSPFISLPLLSFPFLSFRFPFSPFISFLFAPFLLFLPLLSSQIFSRGDDISKRYDQVNGRPFHILI